VWEGIVHEFVLTAHSDTDRCYVWAELVEDFSPHQKVTTVLHIPPVDSPLKAVQAFHREAP
jgi:hypothetical protein